MEYFSCYKALAEETDCNASRAFRQGDGEGKQEMYLKSGRMTLDLAEFTKKKTNFPPADKKLVWGSTTSIFHHR